MVKGLTGHIATALLGRLAALTSLAFFLLSGTAFSEISVLTLNHQAEQVPLSSHIYYKEFKTSSESIDVLKLVPARGWKKLELETANFGYTGSTYWFRINVLSPVQDSRWLIEVAYPVLDSIDFFAVSGDVVLEHATTGDHLHFDRRPLNHRNFVFSQDIKKGIPVSLFFKVTTTTSMQFPVVAWNERAFFLEDQRNLISLGLFYGAMLIMVFYNTFLFIAVRDRAYIVAGAK
ncbi:MAG: hypothetical protein M3Q07_22000 [Pseudobdellovibrionaceae bacterium]|nr:hypothetical protein [Pseudobdellovibrionaceae bacterium]